MHDNEVKYLSEKYPLIGEVLRRLVEGETITEDSPFWETYLIARQRGLVHREGEDLSLIRPSSRGEEYLSLK